MLLGQCTQAKTSLGAAIKIMIIIEELADGSSFDGDKRRTASYKY